MNRFLFAWFLRGNFVSIGQWLRLFLNQLLYSYIILEFVFGSKLNYEQMQFLKISLSFSHIFSAVISMLFMITCLFYEFL